jgi:hypothetical protein
MKKFLASTILIVSTVGNAQSAQISMDDSITLVALYNAERCAPIYKKMEINIRKSGQSLQSKILIKLWLISMIKPCFKQRQMHFQSELKNKAHPQ